MSDQTPDKTMFQLTDLYIHSNKQIYRTEVKVNIILISRFPLLDRLTD